MTTPYLIIKDLSQVNLLAEGEVIESEVLSARVQVVLDLRERPKPTPTRGDITDVHSDLVWPNPLTNKTSPSVNQCTEYYSQDMHTYMYNVTCTFLYQIVCIIDKMGDLKLNTFALASFLGPFPALATLEWAWE